MAAIGLGNLIQNCFFTAPIVGVNSAFETLASKAAGAQNYQLVGVYLNRGCFVVTSVVLLQCILCFWTKDALLLLKQDPIVAKYTQDYIMVYMPALWFYSLGEIYRRLFNCCRKSFLPMVSFMISVSLHPMWCNYFAVEKDMKITGIATAGLLTHSTTLLFMLIFQFLDREMRQTWIKLDMNVFNDLGTYLRIGLPFVIILVLDFWSYDLMTLTSGVIGVNSQAAQVVLMNMNELSYSVAVGLQSAASTFQGNMVGKGDLQGSNRWYKFIMVFSIIAITIETVFLQIFRKEFLDLMTNERAVLAIAEPILIYFIVNIWIESIKGYCRGLIRALELQDRAISPAIVSQWIINPGLIYLLIFVKRWKLDGIWFAKIACETYLMIA